VTGSDLLRRWPHLRRVGRGEANEIAGTAQEQFRRAVLDSAAWQRERRRKRRGERVAAAVNAYWPEVGPVLLRQLAPDVRRLAREEVDAIATNELPEAVELLVERVLERRPGR
jgi:hypothetical protein